MIFIGYNHKGQPISIVNANSKELAYAYWQGKGIVPHSHKSVEEDFTPIEGHITGVYPIMETEELSDYDMQRHSSPSGRTYLLIKRS